MKSTVGKVIETHKHLYDSVITQWKNPLANLEKAIDVYNGFTNLLGAFTQETYMDIFYSKGKKNLVALEKAIEQDTINRMGEIAAKLILSGNAKNIYQPLKEAIDVFSKSIEPSPTLPQLRVEDIEIIKSKPVLQNDKILKRFQYTLENENQAAMYDLILPAMAAYNEANKLLLTFSTPHDIPLLHDLYGIFREDRNGFLNINHGHINRIQ